jgi:hypothetical protein
MKDKANVLVTGFGQDSKEAAKLFEINSKERGIPLFVVDPLKSIRGHPILFILLLLFKDHFFAIREIAKQFEELKGIEIQTLYAYSYGVVSVLVPLVNAKRYVFIAPPLGEVKHKRLERIFFFSPGMVELRKGKLQKRLLMAIKVLKENGKEVCIVVSLLRGNNDYGDECTSYSPIVMEEMIKVSHKIWVLPFTHKEYMYEKNGVNAIFNLVCNEEIEENLFFLYL